MPRRECSQCGYKEHRLPIVGEIIELRGVAYCQECVKPIIEAIEAIPITTTPSMENYEITEYLGIESASIVIGTGVFSEFMGDVADIFGERSTSFEKKLQEGKKFTLKKLKVAAYEAGATAVIGVDLDFTEFSNNRIGIVANGTIVRHQRCKKE